MLSTSFRVIIAGATIGLLSLASAALGQPCTVPDNGTGTVTLPPAGCEYLSPDEVHMIIDGLPAGTTIELAPIHKNFICEQGPVGVCSTFIPPGLCEAPGGGLGGQQDCFISNLELDVSGNGSLAGFQRTLFLQVSCEVHTGPRNPGQPVQSFPTDMFRLQGQLFGDPDFDFLQVTGGSDFGLPSPGHTTLTRLGPPGSNFQVDSFFDIDYRIDFAGAPGSVLAGLAGSTTATIRMSIGGAQCVPAGQDCWSTQCGSTHADFSQDPIPADFFDPGSDPFTGIIELGGATGFLDTIVERLDMMCFPEPLPSSDTVPIELVALNLVSCAPITVNNSGDWDVSVGLSPTPAPPGSMTATKTSPDGGTFDATFFVQPVYTFSRVGNPADQRVFDTGLEGIPPIQMQSSGAPWSTDDAGDVCSADGFAAGKKPGQPCCEEVCHSSFGTAPHEHCSLPPECQECPPDVCEPTPDQTACNPAACPDIAHVCQPRCVNFDPATGAVKVIDCECQPPFECHVDLGSVTPSGPEASAAGPCVVPDNGGGTVTLPPAGCEYLSPDEVHMILDGLPAGTTIELAPIHKDFICQRGTGTPDVCSTLIPPGLCEEPLGAGHHDCFQSTLELDVSGNGSLAGFSRTLSIPVSCEVHTGPRNPGDPVQDFDTDMFRMQGDLFGDPDFCQLTITGGSDFGLPSPGHTTLTRLGPPGSDFVVDSFFDITYRIEFQGCPGSPLAGLSGTTTGTIRMQTGAAPPCVGGCPPGYECDRSIVTLADGTMDVCCDCVPVLPPVITQWRSVKTHGATLGDLPIVLDPTATTLGVTSEPRFGGITRIEVDFDQPVSVVGALEAVDANSAAVHPVTNSFLLPGDQTLVMEWAPGLPDDACYEIDLSAAIAGSPSGLSLAGDTDCRVMGVVGDATGEGRTLLNDFALVKIAVQGGQPVLPGNIRKDIVANGILQLNDVAAVKINNGASVTCP